MLILIVVATIPAVILGYGLNKFLRTLFAAPVVAAGFLVLNGFVLLLGERLRGRVATTGAKPLTDLSIPDALIIGVWQCGALLPGISRAGTTIVGGLLRGFDHQASAHFSFLIALPIIVGATVLEGTPPLARQRRPRRVPASLHRRRARRHHRLAEHRIPHALLPRPRPMGTEPVRLLLPDLRSRRRRLAAGPLMPTRRHLLLVSASLLLGAADRVPVAATPISRMETPLWRARHLAKLEEIRTRPVDLVWLGDSITQDWEQDGPGEAFDFAPIWRHFYGDRNALNLGFGGDTTAHLLWRMQNGELDGLHPKLAIILIGANNMGRVRWNAPQTIAGIDAVITECKRRLPTTRIVLLSVLPSIRNKFVTRTTEAINQGLAERYGNGAVPAVTYIDVTHMFMKNGEVDRTQFNDDLRTPPAPPLHPTAQAQAHIAEAIEPTVAKLMADRAKIGAARQD